MDIQYLYDQVQALMAADTTGHDMAHIDRVLNNARYILRYETFSPGDIEIIEGAVLVHDLIDDKLVEDVEVAKLKTRQLLQRAGANLDQEEAIMGIIENMSFSDNIGGRRRLSPAGQVVQDADRLDAIGAIGIARAFYFGGSKGQPLYSEEIVRNPDIQSKKDYRSGSNVVQHFYDKLLKLEGQMNTSAGRALARSRTQFMLAYLDQLEKEIQGSK